jgi:hypothetical protein
MMGVKARSFLGAASLLGLLASASAQLAVSRNHVTLTPGSPGVNNVFAVSANVLPSGQFATTSYILGSTQTASHFCAVDRLTGAFAWIRAGAPGGTLLGSAQGPGGRVGQYGYVGAGSPVGYNVLGQGWNGVGSSLFSINDDVTGSSRNEIATTAAFDSTGNLYVAGYAYNFSSSAGSNSFVAKYSPSGARLWVRQSGLTALAQLDVPAGIGVDSVGDVWVAIQRGANSTHVWKLNSAGTTLFGSVWQIGGGYTIPLRAKMVNNRFVVAGNLSNRMFVRQYITTSNWITAEVGGDTLGFENLKDFAADSLGNIQIGYTRTDATASGALRTVSRTNVVSTEALFGSSHDVTNVLVDSARNVYLVGWQPDMGGRMALVSKFSPTRSLIWGVSGPQLTFTPISAAMHAPSGDLFILQKNETATPQRMSAFFVSQQPLAVADSYGVTRNVQFLGNVTSNDQYVEDSVAVLVTPPTRGILSLQTNGSFSYTSSGAYTGPDSFTYRLEKGGLAVGPAATVSITISP